MVYLSIKLINNMNSFIKYIVDYSPNHTIEISPTYIPSLNSYYVNGFIVGDGCLYLCLKNKNFCLMVLQITPQ